MSDPLTALLERQAVLILDGGLATELEARGHDLGDELWSARLLVDDPESIGRLHFDYLEAGADCVVSASYQASIPGFARRGLARSQGEGLLLRSVELALEARKAFWSVAARRAGRLRPLVAASVGPYGACLANGSEYTGDYDLDAAGLAAFHRRRLAVLAASGADLLACETIPSAVEAAVLVELLEDTAGPPAWLSFSCADGGHVADGTPIEVAAAGAAASPAVVALGVNCTAPRHVGALVEVLRRITGKPIVVYPNSGERYDAESRRWLTSGAAADLAELATGWASRGARAIGGCCRTGPRDIRRLRRRLLAPAGEPPDGPQSM